MKFSPGDIVQIAVPFNFKFNGEMAIVVRSFIDGSARLVVVATEAIEPGGEIWMFEDELELKTQQDLDNWILDRELTK